MSRRKAARVDAAPVAAQRSEVTIRPVRRGDLDSVIAIDTLTIGDAILITPIASALSIVTIILAIVFLKDKVTKFRGLGIGTAIVGIFVTAF